MTKLSLSPSSPPPSKLTAADLLQDVVAALRVVPGVVDVEGDPDLRLRLVASLAQQGLVPAGHAHTHTKERDFGFSQSTEFDCPTNNRPLINFLLSSDAEISSTSTDRACKSAPKVRKRAHATCTCFRLSFHFACHCWWLGAPHLQKLHLLSISRLAPPWSSGGTATSTNVLDSEGQAAQVVKQVDLVNFFLALALNFDLTNHFIKAIYESYFFFFLNQESREILT